MDLSWWNLIPTYFDGTAFTLGSFPVRWYGIMYIFAFVTGYLTLTHINKKENLGYTKEQFDSLFTWIIAGIIIGARLGYVFFYKADYYLANPTEILIPMSNGHFVGISGMSYHGGLILGTVFTIILPIVAASTRTSTKNIPTPHSSPLTPRKSSTLLVVEDNPDLLSYMCRMLGRDYTVCQATDGRQALDVLQGTDVDLIISDVMMEGMDGLELCRTLKSDITTSHIPVILLTARALASDELEGLQTGADDYIVKPFHLDILRQRIINLLERTRRAQERFSKEPQIEPSEVTVTTLDEEFLAKAIQVVEEHIDEPSFSVDDLSEQMFMHRTNFYRKIQFITGKTPAQFIRLLRLKRARQLLSRGNVLVSQVAFQVGFNSPKKFARYFKEEFGQYPSEYAKSMESTNPIDKNDNL